LRFQRFNFRQEWVAFGEKSVKRRIELALWYDRGEQNAERNRNQRE